MTAGQGQGVSWLQILARWPLVLRDLAAVYHLPPAAVLEQPWSALRTLIVGLLGEKDSRLRRDLKGVSR